MSWNDKAHFRAGVREFEAEQAAARCKCNFRMICPSHGEASSFDGVLNRSSATFETFRLGAAG